MLSTVFSTGSRRLAAMGTKSLRHLLDSNGSTGRRRPAVVSAIQTPAAFQATAATTTHRKSCGKCISCSCHTGLTAEEVQQRRRQSTAQTQVQTQVQTQDQTQVRTQVQTQDQTQDQTQAAATAGLPRWIKDPTFPKGCDVRSVRTLNDATKRWLEVSWENGLTTEYPYLWMRDNCTCPDCYHPTTLSRRFLMRNLDVGITPVDVQVDDSKRLIQVAWSDGHVSPYPFSWLEGRNFTEQALQQRRKWLPRENVFWGRQIQDNIPSASFEEVMTDDRVLYRWLNSLEETGLFRLQGAPQEEGQLDKLAERVAFLKPTHFGSLWEVRTRENPSNLQYTTATLGLHIDLTYYDYTPGVQLLHCLKQAECSGGDNQFCDGFFIAERMRKEQPENYKLLTEVCVDHYDLGEETKYSSMKFFKLQRQPVIRLDRDGKYDRITYNNMVRDNVLTAPLELVNPLYRAMKAFDDMLYDRDNYVEYKMSPGDIICFHNFRVLHGRSGYQPLKAGGRHLQGGFIDWDEMHSKRRVLQMEHEIDV